MLAFSAPPSPFHSPPHFLHCVEAFATVVLILFSALHSSLSSCTTVRYHVGLFHRKSHRHGRRRSINSMCTTRRAFSSTRTNRSRDSMLQRGLQSYPPRYSTVLYRVRVQWCNKANNKNGIHSNPNRVIFFE